MGTPTMARVLVLVALAALLNPTGPTLPSARAAAARQEEPPAAQPRRSPLTTRIGGGRAPFERTYGEPVDTTLTAVFPFGDQYRITGYDSVDVYFHKNLVLFVRLNADRTNASGGQGTSPTGWSRSKARELAARFLPADTELGEETTAADGKAVAEGHSSALEPTFGRATYQAYGAVGDRGDVHAIYTLDGDRVISIELTIGDGSVAASGFTPDEQAYVSAAADRITPLTQSVQRVGTLFANEQNDVAWSNAVRAELVYWRLSFNALRRLSPPPSLDQIHTTYLDALALYASAANDIEAALDSGDRDRIVRAADKMCKAAARLGDGNRALLDLKALRLR